MKITKSLDRWAESAKPGESAVYTSSRNIDHAAMAAARKLYDAGVVTLVQRRETDRSLSYVAQRLRPARARA